MEDKLIPTSKFPGLRYKFEYLNPFQSEFAKVYDQDKNIVCAAPTGSGKTVLAELATLYALENEMRAIFLAPMRALVQEKYDVWTKEGHAFAEHNPCILTGDYKLTNEKKEELQESGIIVMTSEMLDSRSRRMKAEGNKWLLECRTLVVDEAHIIGMWNDGQEPLQERGHKLEAAIMRFSKLNPQCRIVLLSATLPNLPELGEWLTKLNGKETLTIVSDYKPQPVEWHLDTYPELTGYGSYSTNKARMFDKAIDVLQEYPEDIWLVFCHSKNDGRAIKNMIQAHLDIDAPFHCADLEKGERIELENGFRTKGSKILIATSTLAYGVNLPARRVMILDTKRGLNKVHPYDIKQMGGRAGRPGLDPRGDVHWIIGDKEIYEARPLLDSMPPAKSLMFDVDVFAFHIVAGIAEGEINNRKEIKDYYLRCLANHQGAAISDEWLRQLVETLIKYHAIKDEMGILKATSLGRIASWMYFSPFDVFNWYCNFRILFERVQNPREVSDAVLAWAWASIRSNKMGYVAKDCTDALYGFQTAFKDFEKIYGTEMACMGIWERLRGTDFKDMPSSLTSMTRNLVFDSERYAQAILLIDKMYGRWEKNNFIKMLATRIIYGVGWDCAELCLLPKIGKARSKKLVEGGIRSIKDFINDSDKVRELIGDGVYEGAIEEARKMI